MPIHTYRVQEHLGNRSARVVCRALETDSEGYVAAVDLELLPAAQGLSRSLGSSALQAAAHRLEQAVAPLLALEHAGVVACKRVARLEQAWGLISDHVEGVALSSLIEASEVPPRQAVALVGEVAALLHHALELRRKDHLDQGVHLGLTPSRIMVTPEGEVSILGWGVAAVVDELIARRAASGPEIPGRFDPPEQAVPGRIDGLGSAADIFSLGGILREVLVSAAGRVGEEPGAASATFLDPTGGEIEALITAMRAGSPSSRPSAAEVWGRCRELAVGMPGDALAAWACRVCASQGGVGGGAPGVEIRRAKGREPRVGAKLSGELVGRSGVSEAPEVDEVGPSIMAHGRAARASGAASQGLSFGIEEVRPVTFEVEPLGGGDPGPEPIRHAREAPSRFVMVLAMVSAGLVLGGGLVAWRVRGQGSAVEPGVASAGAPPQEPASPPPLREEAAASPVATAEREPVAAAERAPVAAGEREPVAAAEREPTPESSPAPEAPVPAAPELAVAAMTVAPPAPATPPVPARTLSSGTTAVAKARSTPAAPATPSAAVAKETPVSPTPAHEDARRQAIAALTSQDRATPSNGAAASSVAAPPPPTGWQVVGDAKEVYLTLGRSARFEPGAELGPGRYEIWARFDEGADAKVELAGAVRVEAGSLCTVRCDAELELCSGNSTAAP